MTREAPLAGRSALRSLVLVLGIAVLAIVVVVVRRGLQSGDEPAPEVGEVPPPAVEPAVPPPVVEQPPVAPVVAGPPVRGAVIDEDEDGVGGATVQLAALAAPAFGTPWASDAQTYLPPAAFAHEAVSDDDGTFEIAGVGDVAWTVVAHDATGRTGLATWRPGDGDEPLVILRRRVPLAVEVLDGDEQPVGGAQVLHYDFLTDRAPLAAYLTDETGTVTLAMAADDELVVRAEGFATQQLTRLFQRRGAPIVLRPAFPLSGVVVDDEGRPLASAAVTCSRRGLLVQRTDALGRFGWPDVAGTAEEIEVQAYLPDHIVAAASAFPGTEDLRLVVARAAHVVGQVTLPDGAPARGARVWLRDRSWTKATVDEDGVFLLGGVPPGVVKLRVAFSSRIALRGALVDVVSHMATTTLRAAAGARVEAVAIVVEPLPRSFVSVRTLDPGGRPVRRVSVIPSETTLASSSPTTGMDGRMDLVVDAVPGTPVILSLHNGRRADLVREVRATALASAEPGAAPLDVTLPVRNSDDLVRLELTAERTDGVVLGGQALVEWQVTLAGRRGVLPKITPPGRRGEPWRGTVEFPAGEPFTISTAARGCATLISRHEGAPAGPLEIVTALPPQSVVAGVLRTPSGRPLGHAIVEVTVTPQGSEPVQSVAWFDQVFRDGRFFVDQLPAGPARLVVRRSVRDVVAEHYVTLPPARMLDVGEVAVDELPFLRGTVRDAAGESLGGAVVVVRDMSDGERIVDTVTQPDGSFAVMTPERAGARLEVWRPGTHALAVAALPTPVGGAGVEVRLEEGVSLVAEVADRPPFGARMGDLTVRAADGSRVWLDTVAERSGEVQGGVLEFDLRRLPVGRVELRLTARLEDGGTWEASATATLTPGKTELVELRAPK